MSSFQGNEAFLSHCYRSAFLAGCEGAEGYRDWYSMWCMGSFSNEI